MARQGYSKSTPKVGTPTTSKRTDHPGAPSKHPGKLDRMVGGKESKETGPSAPDYLGRG